MVTGAKQSLVFRSALCKSLFLVRIKKKKKKKLSGKAELFFSREVSCNMSCVTQISVLGNFVSEIWYGSTFLLLQFLFMFAHMQHSGENKISIQRTTEHLATPPPPPP